MINLLSWSDVPAMFGNRLFLDYVGQQSRALSYYTHGPTDYAAALAAREGHAYPRAEVADLLEHYNRPLGASEQTLSNISACAADVYCVVGGQQAGLLGGPAYVARKITALCGSRAASRTCSVCVSSDILARDEIMISARSTTPTMCNGMGRSVASP